MCDHSGRRESPPTGRRAEEHGLSPAAGVVPPISARDRVTPERAGGPR